ncbi:ATP-binding protein, partial [Alicyclobacillus fastidiosus]
THLAVALGLEAIRQRHSVYFTTANDLVESLEEAHEKGTIRRKLRQYTKPALLIVDEIGYRKMNCVFRSKWPPIPENSGHLFR